MRPVKLYITAFGPFASTEIVDFREATDAGLFGIYGPTGAGKSSIFNAMTFALFGEGTKREQPIATMRSAHAASDRLTEVALLFELGARRYLVRRQPDQLRPKLRAEGETVHAHAAWLFDVTDLDVDDVLSDGGGTVLAERKVGDVRQHVETLLGYGPEQFRQIVLLPQGRFEKFLLADSKDRLDILRDLFDVSLYRGLTVRMKEAAATARRDVEDSRRAHVAVLAREGFASSDELVTGLETARAHSEALGAGAAAADGQRASADAAYAASEALEKRFAEAEAAARQLADLQQRGPAIEEQRLRRDRADRARRAADLDVAATAAEREHTEALSGRGEAERAAEAAVTRFAESEALFAAERAKAPELLALQRKADALERHRQALDAASNLQLEHGAALEKLRSAERAQADAERDVEQLSLSRQALADRIDGARRAEVERLRFGAERDVARAALAHARAYGNVLTALAEAGRRVAAAEARLLQASDIVSGAALHVEKSETKFVEAQAYRLALHLAEGEPCPICGGRDHPDPARGEGDPAAAEAEWRASQRAFANAARAEQSARTELGVAQGAKTQYEVQLQAIAKPVRLPSDLEAELERIASEISALGEPVEVRAVEEEEAALRARTETGAALLASLQASVQQLRTEEAVARQRYEGRIADVPEDYRIAAALNDALRSIETAISSLTRAMSDAETGHQQAADDKAKAAATLEAMRDRVGGAESRTAQAHAAFAERLSALELTAESYAACRADVPEIDRFDEAIRAYEVAMAEAQGRATEARQAIAGFERPVLFELLARRESARAAAQLALGAAADAKAAYDGLLRLQADLSAELARVERLEAETAPLRGLAEAFDGQNVMRTALESYAIGTMFDHVLESANLRFDPMTAGRYYFERDNESVGGRSKRGLDIRIFDVQTGRTREISTLSGGETFIAALSLALGLSDVVEMNHGAIRLDTIFIDEGFGSLDTENDSGTLDLVLQVLQDIVGQSRAVGLISHVPLVQQAVPNGFSVIKEPGGNRIEPRSA